MERLLHYKGFKGRYDWSEDDNCWWGCLIGANVNNTLVSFEGKAFSDLETAFKDAVDDYLDTKEM